jgi:hypothetical protein
MASCVLGCPKLFRTPKTTCRRAGKIAPKSQFLNFENMETENSKNYNKGGRPPKTDPCRHRYSIKLNDADNTRFLAMLEETGLKYNAAKFIKTALFKREIKYVKLDKAAMDYYMRLTNFYSQYRAIGVNYNQVVKHLKTAFTEKTALALLYRLEKATLELVETNRKIEELTEEFERKYLKKDG